MRPPGPAHLSFQNCRFPRMSKRRLRSTERLPQPSGTRALQPAAMSDGEPSQRLHPRVRMRKTSSGDHGWMAGTKQPLSTAAHLSLIPGGE